MGRRATPGAWTFEASSGRDPARRGPSSLCHRPSTEAVAGIKRTVGGSQPEKEQGVRDLILCHAAFSRRIAAQLVQIDTVLRDLVAFAPLWVEAVEKRRALLLRRSLEEGAHPREAE